MQEFECTDTEIGSFTAMVMAGWAVGASLAGAVIPKYGVRGPMIGCGVAAAAGFAIVSRLESVILAAGVHFLFIGVAFGLDGRCESNF